MSVRFIFGRAGSGKTFHGLESVRRRLREDPIDGPPLLLMVPEQATLQTERALLSADIPAAHRAQVLSFQHLAFMVLESRGISTRQALSEPARAMVLRHLLQERRTRLRYYRRVERNAGFIDRLAETITELIAQAITPTDLLNDPTAPGDDPRQADKLHDLSMLYEAYLRFLGDQRVDPSQFFELATAQIPRCDWLQGGLLFMDGFAGLTRREALLLMALARQCAAVEVSLLLDPDLAAPTGRPGASHAARLFRKTRETWHELHQAFVDAGLTVEEPVLLRPAVPPRFANSPTLATMEQTLFAPPGSLPAAASFPGSATDHIELVQWPTRRLEVQYAVACIMRWVGDPQSPWRYRDLAILVRDLEVYHDLLVSELSAHGIPFFIDRRRPIAHHPLIELLRGGISLLNDRFGLDSVRLLLKTGLLPIEPDAADELENYILAHGIAGPEAWFGAEWTHLRRDVYIRRSEDAPAADGAALARINAARRSFVEAIRPLDGTALTGPLSGAEWATKLRQWMEALKVAAMLEQWITAAETAGDFDLAAQHRQVGRDVPTFLDDLRYALPDTPIPLEEFGGILEQGLSRLTLGLTPPTLDQVLVGTVERSRQPTLKGALVLGFNEGQFPRVPSEDSVLNDDDRAALRARGLPVNPPARVQTLDESLLVYIALTRASSRLVVSYAAAGEDGAVLRPSPYINDLRRACPGLEVNHRADPLRGGEAWNVMSRRDLTTRLALEMRAPPKMTEGDKCLPRWDRIYERALPILVEDQTTRWAFSSLAPIPPFKLSAQAPPLPLLKADAQTGKTALTTGVSAMESYAACPFQFFATHVLRLRQRQEAALAPVDVGQIRHAILEEFFHDLIQAGRALGDLTDADLDTGLRASCARAARRLSGAGILSHGRDAHALRGTRAELAELLLLQRDLAKVSALRPRATELAFGFEPPGLPSLELPLGGDRPPLRLRGFIDRVDLGPVNQEWLGAVTDYKDTRDKRLDFSRVYYGLALQLPVYLVVLRAHGQTLLTPPERTPGPVRPIAALFVSLARPYGLVDRPSAETSEDLGLDEPTSDDSEPAYKPRGMIRFAYRHALDATHQTKWSRYYRVYANKEGESGYENSSDGLPEPAFEAVLEFARRELTRLGRKIVDGDFDVRPVRLGNSFSPCTWCPMHSVCRVEVGLNDVRYLNALPRGAALQAIVDAVTE